MLQLHPGVLLLLQKLRMWSGDKLLDQMMAVVTSDQQLRLGWRRSDIWCRSGEKSHGMLQGHLLLLLLLVMVSRWWRG